MRYPIIDNMEVLEPKVVVMSESSTSIRDAKVYTQREWKFIEKCKNGGIEVIVKLKKH